MRNILLATALAVVLPCTVQAQVLAQVGGVSITLQEVTAADPAAAKDPTVRQKTLLTLINRQSVLNVAEKTNVIKTPEYKKTLKGAGDNIVIQIMVRQFTAAHPITDKEIEAAYKKLFDKPLPVQYRLREITVDSYQEAHAAITEIKKGASFSIVAAEKSQDPHTASLGGEIGWVAAPQLLAPILKAVQSLRVEEVTGPVAIPKGYVVLQLLGKRETPKPTMDQIKPQLTASLRQQEWDKYVIKLRTEQNAHLIIPLPGK